MTNGAECPRECDFQLKTLFKKYDQLRKDHVKHIDELKMMDAKQWEAFDTKIHDLEGAVSERVRIRTLVAIFGVLCSVLLAILGFSFSSLKTSQKETVVELREVHKQVTTLNVQLEERTGTHDPP